MTPLRRAGAFLQVEAAGTAYLFSELSSGKQNTINNALVDPDKGRPWLLAGKGTEARGAAGRRANPT